MYVWHVTRVVSSFCQFHANATDVLLCFASSPPARFATTVDDAPPARFELLDVSVQGDHLSGKLGNIGEFDRHWDRLRYVVQVANVQGGSEAWMTEFHMQTVVTWSADKLLSLLASTRSRFTTSMYRTRTYPTWYMTSHRPVLCVCRTDLSERSTTRPDELLRDRRTLRHHPHHQLVCTDWRLLLLLLLLLLLIVSRVLMLMVMMATRASSRVIKFHQLTLTRCLNVDEFDVKSSWVELCPLLPQQTVVVMSSSHCNIV